MAAGDRSALARVQPTVVENTSGPARADGNNVDIDDEMASLNKNTLLYRAYAQIIASHEAAARSAITGQ